MRRNLVFWCLTCGLLGLALIAGELYSQETRPQALEQRIAMAQATGAVLLVLAFLAVLFRRRLGDWLRLDAEAAAGKGTESRHGLGTLFVVSFVVLFVEVMLIRYCGSQIRIFSFYKNVPLVGCFLGLGLGCCRGGGSSRDARAFLLWLIPLGAFLAQGALIVDGYLAEWTAKGSSEQVLGDVVYTQPSSGGEVWRSQLWMGLFCVAVLVAVTLLFQFLGRLLGEAFTGVPRLPAYTVNILGSLLGILGFVVMSYLRTPPWVWFLVGLLPLLWWIRGRGAVAAVAFVAVNAALVAPQYGDTVWSPYQKLVGHNIPAGPGGTGSDRPGYMVEISDVFYQVAVDLRPAAVAQMGRNPFPHYDGAFAGGSPGRVLVVGAGTGNDVAAALRANATEVIAVDIDPAIVEMGRRHHPEEPYADPRVRIRVDDARHAFRVLEPRSFDTVVFGLLDSHTQLGISSVRLDNYVFTLESFRSAIRLLRPGGRIVITAASFRPWFRDRLAGMLAATCGGQVHVRADVVWYTYSCRVQDPPEDFSSAPAGVTLPRDDWPFLYLPKRGIPRAYLLVVGMLALVSVGALRAGGLRLGRFTASHSHLFFLGAAFLLMEVYAINRLALLFGTTWLVSAVTIGLVLTLIVLGNLAVMAFPNLPYPAAYAGLAVSLLTGYFLEPDVALGSGLAAALAYGALVVSPVFFAALIFARSFRSAEEPGAAIGFNVLGSVLGGWAEYSTMATGIRAMALLALVFYLLSLLAWMRTAHGEPAE